MAEVVVTAEPGSVPDSAACELVVGNRNGKRRKSGNLGGWWVVLVFCGAVRYGLVL